ncbi:MAG: ParB/RepB/Spo0J family partition protein [Clostridia bacterium]|nr:ParB/RepB/Spo0J family partition protein [Clostridia bacterium]
MAKKTGLGRGIDAIFLDNALEENAPSSPLSLRLSQIDPAQNQPRKHFDGEALAGLADSIAAHGVLQPILVRQVSEDRYVIVAGERRWRAARMAGLNEIPVIVTDMDEKSAAQIALIENIQRENLNPIEEAAGFLTLSKEYGMTQEEISEKVGRSRPSIANALRLLDLPEKVQDMVINGSLSAGHARTLLGLRRREHILLLAEIAVSKSLSVRELEAAVRKYNALKDEEEEETEPLPFKVDYVKELEQRMMSQLGRRVKLSTNGNKKSLTLFFEDNEDLDDLLTLLCGKDFLSTL